jgi:hypothetical protein
MSDPLLYRVGTRSCAIRAAHERPSISWGNDRLALTLRIVADLIPRDPGPPRMVASRTAVVPLPDRWQALRQASEAAKD